MYFNQQQQLLILIFLLKSVQKCLNHDAKLIGILRRQYHIILAALGENLFFVYMGPHRYVTPPNTEYIFSQLAANTIWYAVSKSQLF